VPKILLRRVSRHGGKRFCLLVGFRSRSQKSKSNNGAFLKLLAFANFAFFAAKNSTPSLTHSFTPKLTLFPTLQADGSNLATAAYVKDHAPRIAFLETNQIIALSAS
jgi:recombinational DNA repair protein (RecF pathway)